MVTDEDAEAADVPAVFVAVAVNVCEPPASETPTDQSPVVGLDCVSPISIPPSNTSTMTPSAAEPVIIGEVVSKVLSAVIVGEGGRLEAAAVITWTLTGLEYDIPSELESVAVRV
jgi:hypothetical protein